MSFYGTIYNQISNAFDTFYVQNTGKDKKDFLSTTTNSMNIKADGREGELKLDTGNKWIQLQGNSTNNFCKIYHSQPDTSGLTSFVVAQTSNSTEAKNVLTIDLSEDTYLKISGLNYDKAGHVSNQTDQYLYFKMVNAAESLADFEKRLVNTEEFVEGYETRMKAEEEYSKTFNSAISSHKTKIENLESLTGTKSNFTNTSGVTLCNAIGNIDYLRNGGKDSSDKEMLKFYVAELNSDTKNLSMCDYINALKNEVTILITEVRALTDRLNKLEGK